MLMTFFYYSKCSAGYKNNLLADSCIYYAHSVYCQDLRALSLMMLAVTFLTVQGRCVHLATKLHAENRKTA